MSKKICLDAGHATVTGGKQTCNGTAGVVKEWTMNDAVCRYIAEYLQDYDAIISRVDDTTGKTDVPVAARTTKINNENPDLFISIHHNANTGVWGNWTGTSVFYNVNKPARDADLAKLMADSIATQCGLKNRGALQDQAYVGYTFHMVRETKSSIPSVLCEGGFMDSTVDYPVITSEKGQRSYARAVANICISYLGLSKKASGVPIRGKSVVTPDIISAFIKRNNPEFDNKVSSMIVYWADHYGIKGDIVCCQGIAETGWFKYGGGTAVKPEHHNYCGLGVTTLGQPGCMFATVSDGAEAFIQHLYAYTCKDNIPVDRKLVDPRFNYVTRGVSPNWTDLNMKWAMTKDYGEKILNIYEQLKAFAATYKPDFAAINVTNMNSEGGLTMTQYEELKKMITDLKENVDKWTANSREKYQYTVDVPQEYRQLVQRYINKNIIIPDKDQKMHLSNDFIRAVDLVEKAIELAKANKSFG